jgi:hypothetical protein
VGKLLNILIRTSQRPKQFADCIKSITDQDTDLQTAVHVCRDTSAPYVNNYKFASVIEVTKNEHKYGYNLYLQPMKDLVHEGWGLYLDDDDLLLPDSLQQLHDHLHPGNSYIVPFLRDGKQKPWPSLFRNESIEEGCIGLPCLIFWHEHGRYLQFDYTQSSDYNAIKRLSRCVKLQWLQIPVVNSPVRGWGRME